MVRAPALVLHARNEQGQQALLEVAEQAERGSTALSLPAAAAVAQRPRDAQQPAAAGGAGGGGERQPFDSKTDKPHSVRGLARPGLQPRSPRGCQA